MPQAEESELLSNPRPVASSSVFFVLGVMSVVALMGWNGARGEPDRVDPDTGAGTWQLKSAGVSLSLTQLLPDQIRAFYVNRGFNLDDAEVFATACVYMAVMRNESADGEIAFRLSDWTLQTDAGPGPIPAHQEWLDQWKARGVPNAARLAFRWAQLPAQQHYAPGEWNQGMLATGLAPGTRFDLTARWTLADENYEGTLKNVRCID